MKNDRNSLFPTTKKRTRCKADALVLKKKLHIGGLMGIGREYVEQKNTAIPSRTTVCTENIYRFVMGGMKPVPVCAIFIASPSREHATFSSIPP